MDALTGRTAVVTGAASGIGLALARRFAADGMKVVMSDVDPKRLEESVAQVDAVGDVLAVAADVSRFEDVERLAARAEAAFGPIHLLGNNAGVQSSGTVWEYELAEWQWLLGVNLWGVIHGIRAFVPGMIAHGGHAHVVNTSSVGGLVTFPGMAPYAASKSAVIAISESLHLDLRAHDVPVGVSVLCPGPTLSARSRSSPAFPACRPRRWRGWSSTPSSATASGCSPTPGTLVRSSVGRAGSRPAMSSSGARSCSDALGISEFVDDPSRNRVTR